MSLVSLWALLVRTGGACPQSSQHYDCLLSLSLAQGGGVPRAGTEPSSATGSRPAALTRM